MGSNDADASGSLADRFPQLDVLSESPENAQVSDRAVLDQLVTERGEHYIRNHYPTPEIDADEWTVSLTGAIDGGDLPLDELRDEYATESVAHTMECSGNGREYFEPDAEGHQWGLGAVGTAVWTGTPVRHVLRDRDADLGKGRWVSFVGGDAPEDEEAFCRSIPMPKALDDCLLAYEMNGRPLPSDHGYPIRLVVPGWFGNNSVKWVDRIHVGDEMVNGEEWEGYTEYQQGSYRLFFDEAEKEDPTHYADVATTDTYDLANGDDVRSAYFFDQLPNSLVCGPDGDDALEAGTPVTITGVAWAGTTPVERVEVSTDGGETWNEADLPASPLGVSAWRRFEYEWTPEPGDHTLVSRAVDERGRAQAERVASADEGVTPIGEAFPWNVKGYGNNAYESAAVEVTVEASDELD